MIRETTDEPTSEMKGGRPAWMRVRIPLPPLTGEPKKEYCTLPRASLASWFGSWNCCPKMSSACTVTYRRERSTGEAGLGLENYHREPAHPGRLVWCDELPFSEQEKIVDLERGRDVRRCHAAPGPRRANQEITAGTRRCSAVGHVA